MGVNTKMHDGIIAIAILAGSFLTFFFSINWIIIPVLVAVVMLQSSVTGFCPLYFTISKIRKNT